jgi:hypothetical protein
MPDWLRFFDQTLAQIHRELAVVLDAPGCREGWLQGEFFRAGRKYDLAVNTYPFGKRAKADLSAGDPVKMVAEIKIVASWYQPKQRYAVEADVSRLKAIKRKGVERFMILIVPGATDATRTLGRWLTTCSFSDSCRERGWPEFRVRIWKL